MTLLLSLFLFLNINAQTTSMPLTGTWKFTSIIYRGKPQDLPNPDLDLRFIFYENNVLRLKWLRHGEKGFCEKKATYLILDEILYQKTFWLNPANDRSCSTDPEMRLSSETYTDFKLERKQLLLKMNLGDEDLIYVFSFLPTETDDIGREK